MSNAWALLGTVIQEAAGIKEPAADKAEKGSAASGPPFLPAAAWQGQKQGYYFGRGRLGQGYYRDSKQQVEADDGDAEGDEDGPSVAPARVLNPEELLKQAEEEAHIDDIQALDAKGLRRIVTSFEKKYKDNLALRVRYPDAPEKFLDSEVDLDEQIKSLLQVAGSPDLYPLLVELNPFPTLLACVGHENVDIAADTMELLREMTDADVAEGFEDEVRGVVSALLESNALELIVQRLTALNEKVEEESKAVFNCLSIFENLVDVDPSVAEQLLDRTKILKWLLTRMRVREFDSNKQEASELMAILIQGSEVNQKRLRDANGIDTLLQCVAPYKSRDPQTAEEEEFMQNCFDVLCAALMPPEAKIAFVSAEGVELMYLMLASKKQSRYGALRLLDFAMTRCAPSCEKLVDLGGLKHLFGAFMGKAKIRGPTGERNIEKEVEERCVSLIASCLTQLTSKAGRRERVAAKFVEAEFEKTDRLMEIFFRYQAQVAECELTLMESMEALQEGETIDSDEVDAARMGAGLFTLQQCALIIGLLWATGDVGLRKRVLSSLHLKKQSLAAIREVLLEYHGSIGDDGSADEAARLLQRVRDALTALGATTEEIDATRPGSSSAAAPTTAPTNGQPATTTYKQPPPAIKSEPNTNGKAGTKQSHEADMDMEMDDGPAAPPPASAKADTNTGPVKRERGTEDQEDSRATGRGSRGGDDDSRAASTRGKDDTRDRVRDGDAGRDSRSDRHREKEPRDRERDKERERDRDRERDRERERDRSDRDRDRERDRGRERDKDRERERDRERDRDRREDRESDRDRRSRR